MAFSGNHRRVLLFGIGYKVPFALVEAAARFG
jgi:hypothetical protein